MAEDGVRQALLRVEEVLQRRPAFGIKDDAPAHAVWEGATGCSVSHPNGARVATDMPPELGGQGAGVSPGWLFRSGIAACALTAIALTAARAGVRLQRLEVDVSSRSDLRGLLGMADETGAPVYAGSRDLGLRVSVAADGLQPPALQALVAQALGRSPMSCVVQRGSDIAVDVTVLAV